MRFGGWARRRLCRKKALNYCGVTGTVLANLVPFRSLLSDNAMQETAKCNLAA